MGEYIKPQIPLDLEPLRDASGSAILSFGMSVIGGELVNHFAVEADSPLLTVWAETDAEPSQASVVRHGTWLAVSADLSSKYSEGTSSDMEAIKSFLAAETALTDSARTWPKRIGSLIGRGLRSIGNPVNIMVFAPGVTVPDELLKKPDTK